VIHVGLPGRPLDLATVVLDINGTLARDGELIEGVAAAVATLASRAEVLVASGDTFGTSEALARALGVAYLGVGGDDQAAQKLRLVEELGPSRTAVVGNGRNDVAALARAALGICVIGPEGCASEAAFAADVLAPSASVALGLLLEPDRLVATLRP
jgi:P-type E1-E2 ATPase